jgi:serine/threonine protein phosphatase 1
MTYGISPGGMKVQRFAANAAGRDFIVGDIHGCTDEFRRLLAKVQFNPECDRVFATGDLIDRGPDSVGAAMLLAEPWFFSVMGNHELMMLEAQAEPSNYDVVGVWLMNGGTWANAATNQELDEITARLIELPLVIVVGEGENRFNVLHAEFFGANADLDAGQFDEWTVNRLLWGRSLASGEIENPRLPESSTYVGHTILDDVGEAGTIRYIDTGAFVPYWAGQAGKLTMVEHATGEIFQEGKVSA